MKRYSKKRQAIWELLCSTDTHPSAEWIYERLKGEYPDLSLATVYRNLKEMKKEGVILSMGTVCGEERFDADREYECHAICRRCGAIVDIRGLHLPDGYPEIAAKQTGFLLTDAGLQFFGICQSCQNRDNSGSDLPKNDTKETQK